MTAPLTAALERALEGDGWAPVNELALQAYAARLTAHLRADPELREALAAALPPIVVSGPAGGWRFEAEETASRILDRLTSENSEGETT